MRFRGYLLGIAIVSFSLLMIYIFYGQIAVFVFGAMSDTEIEYREIKTGGMASFVFKGFAINEKKTGIGIFAEDADIRLSLSGADIRRAIIDFNFKKVHFLKKAVEKPISYDNLDGLLAIPFSSDWTYPELRGRLQLKKGGIRLENLMAKSDDLMMSFTGDLNDDRTIKSDIVIYFADKLIAKIPPELTNVILKDEGGKWKSLSVKLEGNYATPSIQVSGRLFRLNIGLKE
ncbi:MAG: hypothetical protein NC938_01115 [Candidatus Omnitrophica bacterium]|nr:hypothetical protein [Candidatus Omnitrophota bacterium]